MAHQTISTDSQLESLCDRLGDAAAIGIDTEFVSEDTYRPQLCLVQVATEELLAIIDPFGITDLQPFWQRLAEGDHQTIVHAGREELGFSLRTVGARPANLFDIQIAAGLVGFEYPAGYAALTFKITGQRPPKGETRTDWRKRPLTRRQIEYALADVRYLLPMRDRLQQMLLKHDRLDWMDEEMRAWQKEVEAHSSRPRWRRVPGISGLSARGLAIVRDLWRWREEEASRRDRPARKILRDDLIVEIARRGSSDPKQIRAIRGLERSGLKRAVPQLAECVARALDNPEASQPKRSRRETPSQVAVLGQFLSAALTTLCARAQIAPSMVGTASDIRHLISHRLNGESDHKNISPKLAEGWRANFVGNVLEDLLAGRTSMRVMDAQTPDPLAIEPIEWED